jgi:hypothetical protein
MQASQRWIIGLMLAVFCLGVSRAGAESVDDRFTQISPKHTLGGGEYIHGTGYGKILMRVMIFGAVPQQGIHYVPEGTDLLFALLYAGGYGSDTKLNGITIRRRGIQELLEIDLEDLLEEGKSVPKLADGDVINVPFNWRKDYQDFGYLTTVFTALTGLVISVVALSHH